jgi:XTP/dITP diphosphohydrolase
MKAVRVLVATSNRGKLRDFGGAAARLGVEIAALSDFHALPQVEEDGATFEANARKKAEFYSRLAPGEIVVADDSGLQVEALGGAPGVQSARYAGAKASSGGSSQAEVDAANNHRLLYEFAKLNSSDRNAKFVCVLAAARYGITLETFTGEVRGQILSAPRGTGGFGYDPLFFVQELGKTLAEVSAEEKAAISHRGRAFRKFLEWFTTQESVVGSR